MFRASRDALSLKKVALFLTLVAVSSCKLNIEASGPSVLVKFSGDQQTAATNTTLPTPLAVLVASQFGERLQNVTVTWTIVSGGGTLSATSTQTDESGVGSVIYTTGATAGPVVVQARVAGIPPLTFNVTVT